MTDILAISASIASAVAALVLATLPRPLMAVAARVAAIVIALLAWSGATAAIASAPGSATGGLDRMGAIFLGVNGLVGMCSCLLSPGYLRHAESGFLRGGRRWYYFGIFLFWSLLLAIPQAANLGVAWILIEASTGLTAFLVAYSGTRRALEAGWKYLILTTLGLTVALLGILILYGMTARSPEVVSTLDWAALHAAAAHLSPQIATVAVIFIYAGFAAKIGWAPVHHWLPDAHSEAPAPVSAMLSAALLPSVMLVVWRLDRALSVPPIGSPHILLMGFGLASLAASVPFLWTPLPVKRLLAYSSLEHMGVIAIGLGFAQPLATAGVVLHVCGHALAKSLGFYATIPLFHRQPALARRPLRAAAQISPAAATALGISLGALSGLPPSPLFFSELLILVGGISAGQIVVVTIAALLLALTFVGLAHQTIEGLFSPTRRPIVGSDSPATTWAFTAVLSLALIALLPVAGIVAQTSLWADIIRGMS